MRNAVFVNLKILKFQFFGENIGLKLKENNYSMADFNEALYWVQKQYFQAVAMKNFDWEKLKNVKCDESNTVQIAVLNAVCRIVEILLY